MQKQPVCVKIGLQISLGKKLSSALGEKVMHQGEKRNRFLSREFKSHMMRSDVEILRMKF